MTVKQLREYLAKLDDDLIVLEECKSELRVLRFEDVHMDRNQVNPSTYYTDDGQEIEGGVLILGAWS